MRMWLNSLDAIHTSLLYGAIKRKEIFSLFHMKDVAQMEECSGRSEEGHTAEREILSVLHVVFSFSIIKTVSASASK